jgi:hypothetical protein
MSHLYIDPRFKPLSHDPAFLALLTAIGLPSRAPSPTQLSGAETARPNPE